MGVELRLFSDNMKMKHSPLHSIQEDIRMSGVLEPLKRGHLIFIFFCFVKFIINLLQKIVLCAEINLIVISKNVFFCKKNVLYSSVSALICLIFSLNKYNYNVRFLICLAINSTNKVSRDW